MSGPRPFLPDCMPLRSLDQARGRREEALRLFQHADALLEKLVEQNPHDRHLKTELAMVCVGLGSEYDRLARPDDALRAFHWARWLLVSLLEQGPESEQPHYQRELKNTKVRWLPCRVPGPGFLRLAR